VRRRTNGAVSYCTPGGGIKEGETPEEAAVRELREECNVEGTVVKRTSVWVDPYDDGNWFYTFQVDIGEQEPSLGYDPELDGEQILIGVEWKGLDEITEVDRAFLWAAGLVGIREFAEELLGWERVVGCQGRVMGGEG